MSTARLRALRMVGFKSFSDPTVVEFGPGVSAVVGPNGSGKSNLADALRWAMGEAGRSLRTRRAEDVIFAGSARRKPIGMADVTLVIENGDRLLPVDYAEVELARRLYRSGENEYLVNRQRVRLRDLLELLDSANLADNAFLFIGQGMVDQALALRPEERRALFEEAAGVRRHERRRRQAESELAEAESNVVRLRDLLAELRPQARRLAAQAEQEALRRSAAEELAEALVAAGRAKWTGISAAARKARDSLHAARTRVHRLASERATAEARAEALRGESVLRAEREHEARRILEEQRAAAVEMRVQETRSQAELAALRRDRERLGRERAEIEARAADARRALALRVPEADPEIEEELREVERALRAAEDELHRARTSRAALSDRAASLSRARATREAELAEMQRRAADAARRLGEQAQRHAAAEEAMQDSERRRAAAAEHVGAARERDLVLAGTVVDEKAELDRAEAARWEIAARAAATQADLERCSASLAGVRSLLDAGDGRVLLEATQPLGGRLFVEEIDVAPSLRLAFEAAARRVLGSVVVDAAAALAQRGAHGTLLLRDAREGEPTVAEREVEAAIVERAESVGGGRVADALQRDDEGVAARVVSRCVWVPDLAAALEFQPRLAAGWTAVTVAGEAVIGDGVVELAPGDSALAHVAERDRLEALVAETGEAARRAGEELRSADAALRARGEAFAAARAAAERARREASILAEEERVAGRRAESAAREAAWERAQHQRLESEARRIEDAVQRMAAEREAEAASEAPLGSPPVGGREGGQEMDALAGHVARLSARRDALRSVFLERQRERQRAEEEQRRAEIRLAIDEARLGELETQESGAVAAAAEAEEALEALKADSEAQRRAVEGAAAHLHALSQAAVSERALLDGAERATADIARRAQSAESEARAAELRELELRLQAETTREQLLVELASIGPAGLRSLRGDPGRGTSTEEPLDAGVLEQALDDAARAWDLEAAAPPVEGDALISPSRLASLRRRYHELGAGNPFAAEEYASVSERLGSLEAQRADVETAISGTRRLIADLEELVARQFMATFAALESAFARRFEQLFDGGEAQLVLTTPDDLGATGVEILARPPGKRRQPLAMLSGGERALTAVALLFAMLEVRPVPFCVLDEVDAALDEANVGRFAAALRGLAETIQFVVITHNRGTIEAADALYGITLGEDAVSRVVSMRLADVAPPDAASGRDAASTPPSELDGPARALASVVP